MPDLLPPPAQPSLDLPRPDLQGMDLGDFVLAESNEAARLFMVNWRSWPDRRLCLAGPAAAGKTHLARIWAALAGAAVHPAEALLSRRPSCLVQGPGLAIEDADRFFAAADGAAAARAETALFHLCNLTQEQGKWLLLTSRTPPGDWPVRLPDLATRLGAFPIARIEAPEPELLQGLLRKRLKDRQVRPSDFLVRYVARRIARAHNAAIAAAALLEAYSWRNGSGVTFSLAKRLYEAGGFSAE